MLNCVSIFILQKVLALKKLYDEIDDVDLLAGIASETLIQDAFVGPTLFCIMTKQLQLFRFSDRFWFERGDQFHSLTIRKFFYSFQYFWHVFYLNLYLKS